jgi:hypothetical protein
MTGWVEGVYNLEEVMFAEGNCDLVGEGGGWAVPLICLTNEENYRKPVKSV